MAHAMRNYVFFCKGLNFFLSRHDRNVHKVDSFDIELVKNLNYSLPVYDTMHFGGWFCIYWTMCHHILEDYNLDLSI
jgi:hypothetical protein